MLSPERKLLIQMQGYLLRIQRKRSKKRITTLDSRPLPEFYKKNSREGSKFGMEGEGLQAMFISDIHFIAKAESLNYNHLRFFFVMT